MAFYCSIQSGYRKPGQSTDPGIMCWIHTSIQMIRTLRYIDHSLIIAVEIQMETGNLHEAENNLYEPLTLLPDTCISNFQGKIHT